MDGMFVHVNAIEKKAGVAFIISDQVNFKTRSLYGGNKGHFINMKGPLY